MSDELKSALTTDVAMKDADVARPRSKRRRKVSYLTQNKIFIVDYKDTALLEKFINKESGKMTPSRQSGTTAKQQRQIAKSIKQAREMALLPFVNKTMNTERREYRKSEAPAAPAAAAAE
jgi:small subunit ribosomal protein S18